MAPSPWFSFASYSRAAHLHLPVLPEAPPHPARAGFKSRARDVETKSITLEGRAGESRQKTPLYQVAGLLQKGWAAGVRAPKLAALLDPLAGHGPVVLKGFPLEPTKKHQPLLSSAQLSPAAEAQEKEERLLGTLAPPA